MKCFLTMNPNLKYFFFGGGGGSGEGGTRVSELFLLIFFWGDGG